ncbi:hypothetical protein HDU93_009269, partial [Gonapodya sp. JEL0774]
MAQSASSGIQLSGGAWAGLGAGAFVVISALMMVSIYFWRANDKLRRDMAELKGRIPESPSTSGAARALQSSPETTFSNEQLYYPQQLVPGGSTASSEYSSGGAFEVNKPFTAVNEYRSKGPDELDVRIGDEIMVEGVFPDGWAFGRNPTTGAQGVLPLIILEGAEYVMPNLPAGTPPRTMS